MELQHAPGRPAAAPDAPIGTCSTQVCQRTEIYRHIDVDLCMSSMLVRLQLRLAPLLLHLCSHGHLLHHTWMLAHMWLCARASTCCNRIWQHPFETMSCQHSA